MKFHHHDLEIELDDTWWEEAGMKSFTPLTNAYCTNIEAANGKEIFIVKIVEVSPVRRNPGVAIFNTCADATAKDRVISILTGFRTSSTIPPVEVVSEPEGSNFRYKLVHGAHRFYCSLAAGFSHVPAIKGFDINTIVKA
jgi:hypothetical protein